MPEEWNRIDEKDFFVDTLPVPVRRKEIDDP
jgi:hypothetical protein